MLCESYNVYGCARTNTQSAFKKKMLLFSNINSNTLYSNSVNILLNFEEGNLDSLRNRRT